MIVKRSDKLITMLFCFMASGLLAFCIPVLTEFRGMGVVIKRLVPLAVLLVFFVLYKSDVSFSLKNVQWNMCRSLRWSYLGTSF